MNLYTSLIVNGHYYRLENAHAADFRSKLYDANGKMLYMIDEYGHVLDHRGATAKRVGTCMMRYRPERWCFKSENGKQDVDGYTKDLQQFERTFFTQLLART